MNKKLIALLLGGLTAGALSSSAQTAPAAPASAPAPATATAAPAPAAPAAPAPPSLSITVTPTYVTSYMFRGQRLGGQAFEPSVEADYGNWALGVWANTPIADKVDGQSDPEIDPYGSYTYSVNDSLSIVPAFTLYTYVNAPTSSGYYRSTFEPSVTVNYTLDGLKISPEFFYDVILKAETAQVSLAYTVPVKSYSTELDFLVTAGEYYLSDGVNHSSPDTHVYGDYWLAGVSIPFQLNPASKLSVGYAYTEGSDGYIKQAGSPKVSNSESVGRGVFSISFAYTF